MKIPEELKYTKGHEWIRVEGDELVVGITDFAQNQLTELTFVELPEVGQTVTSGDEIAVVESVKQASDVYAVASGDIVAANDALESDPELVNTDPYGEGWIYRLKVSDTMVLNDFMDASAYAEIAPEG